MSLAERVYLYKTNGKIQKENAEERAFRFTQRRNRIFSQIDKISNYKELMAVNKELKDLEDDGYTDNNDLLLLHQRMHESMLNLKQTIETNQKEILARQQKILKEKYSENMETLLKLDAESNSIVLQLCMQLSNDNVKNKVILSNFIKSAGRADALALMKIAQMPAYERLITGKMKEDIVMLCKSDAELKWQEKHNIRLEEVGKELAKTTMQLFMLNKAEKIIFKQEDIYFENK